jgi:isoleucyl-tRNA synthetase
MAEKSSFFDKPRSLFEMEEAVLAYWKEQEIFAKTLKQTEKGEVYSFYDGPPFITGIPHYATLLPSIAKDVVPRFQTMKGRYVRRIWGWDVHGLPAENQVEKQLGLKTKKDIEKFGIAAFIAECRKYVADVSDAWRWYIDHIGRWADMDNAYRTDELGYMESVIWAFKQLYDKGLIYRGRRVSLFCTRCATPLSKFEITMDEGNYREVEDPAVTVGFRLKNDDVYLLAWTTTPWTLPANLALAIDGSAEYVKVSDGERFYILAHQALERYQDGSLKVVEYIPGKKLLGESYEPLYDFHQEPKDEDFKIYDADFVSMEEGTGIVHIAPGFGEDDTALGEANNLSTLLTIDDEGHFLPVVKDWQGDFYRDANPKIIDNLQGRSHLFRQAKITHSYPHCYRCGTPLIYKSQVSWYMKIDELRQDLLKKNKEINWVPPHFGKGRFKHNLQTAPDWSLSRTRYWGTPIPVWETDDGELFVPGSVKEIAELSEREITDLHRPAIDEIALKLPNGKTARRVKEVLDVWFESGSMPYAQDHYPFGNKEEFERHNPTDFIIEYTGQLRGWFYYLHVLGNALFGKNAFKNVAVTGVLMGTDGRKMSKSYGNYPDPRLTIEKYGAESLRLYFLTSKIMNGEDIAISEEEIREQSRLLNVLQNSVQYYVTYSSLHKSNDSRPKRQLLDRWIIVRTKELEQKLHDNLEKLDFQAATKEIRPFIEDLSTWYIRRNRERFVKGDQAAIQTLGSVLMRFAVAVAPVLPFSADRIYLALGGQLESVHLEKYPRVSQLSTTDDQLVREMQEVRQICSVGNMLRAQAGISLRQPLGELGIEGKTVVKESKDYQQIVLEELNVKELVFKKPTSSHLEEARHGDLMVYLDTKISDKLREEGQLRELQRKLQDARKKAGLQVGEKVILNYSTLDDDIKVIFEKYSKEIASAGSFKRLVLSDGPDLQELPGEGIKFAFTK